MSSNNNPDSNWWKAIKDAADETGNAVRKFVRDTYGTQTPAGTINKGLAAVEDATGTATKQADELKKACQILEKHNVRACSDQESNNTARNNQQRREAKQARQ